MFTPDKKGWSYNVYAVDTPAAAFGPFRDLIQLWRDKAGDRPFPTWRDFELADFKNWWGRLSLANVHRDPVDLDFALWGSKLTDWWGIDFTKKEMDKAYKDRDENWTAYEGPYFQALLDHGGIGVVGGDLRLLDKNYTVVQGVDLLLNKNGEVAQILSGYVNCTPDPPTPVRAEPIWTL